jgi:hypothetical protein
LLGWALALCILLALTALLLLAALLLVLSLAALAGPEEVKAIVPLIARIKSV